MGLSFCILPFSRIIKWIVTSFQMFGTLHWWLDSTCYFPFNFPLSKKKKHVLTYSWINIFLKINNRACVTYSILQLHKFVLRKCKQPSSSSINKEHSSDLLPKSWPLFCCLIDRKKPEFAKMRIPPMKLEQGEHRWWKLVKSTCRLLWHPCKADVKKWKGQIYFFLVAFVLLSSCCNLQQVTDCCNTFWAWHAIALYP